MKPLIWARLNSAPFVQADPFQALPVLFAVKLSFIETSGLVYFPQTTIVDTLLDRAVGT